MARKNHSDALGVAGAETIIGTGVNVRGDLNSESDIIIDGNLEGSLTTIGDVTIGVNATIKATIRGYNVTVAGHLTGNIEATGDTTIRETGQVQGDIRSAGLAISTGGVFIGRNHMQPVANLGDIDSEATSKPTTGPKSKA